MKIALSQIKPSPNPIRKTWDEEKMKELQWSLMEEGQVEPIGVRVNGTGYMIVWGHRRAEAAKRAGWKEIDCVIIPVDEINNLIQAGIENLAGEEMSTDDKAEWAKKLLDLGINLTEISRRSTVPRSTIEKWLIYINEPEIKSAMAHPKRTGDSDYRKVVEIHNALQDDLEAKKAVAQKVAKEDLSTSQTRAVADAYHDAPTPEVKAQILKTPIISKDTSADVLRRSMNRVHLEGGLKTLHEAGEWDKEQEERKTYTKFDFAVKEFLDATKLYKQSAEKIPYLVKYGKFSPEAAKFSIRKIDTLIDDLKNAKEALDGVK